MAVGGGFAAPCGSVFPMPPSDACSDSEREHTGESDSPVKRMREAPAPEHDGGPGGGLRLAWVDAGKMPAHGG